MRKTQSFGAFRPVPRTGIIYVTEEAVRRGFSPRDPDWCNLGQGQPETGSLPGAPSRVRKISIRPEDQDYAPVPGLWELREAVAGLYNKLYRKGRGSKYSAENVAISGGGRTSLTRAAAAIGHINLGHFLPDYTAYEELLDVFRNFTPIPILLDGRQGYSFDADALRAEILGRGLGAVLLSNPCNPTGRVISGGDLAAWLSTTRQLGCTLLLDEFYSHYIWTGDTASTVSAAEFVKNVDKDPVLIFNGLTKNWRYPGWRVTWTLGPKNAIEALSSAGSFLDGGASRPLQRAAIPLLSVRHQKRETAAIRSRFLHKKDLMMRELGAMGMTFDLKPQGTFYVWCNLSRLPASLSDGMRFFSAALRKKVIVVPGEFFDVNPGGRRPGRTSRFKGYARFSFGPTEAVLKKGLKRIAAMIRSRS